MKLGTIAIVPLLMGAALAADATSKPNFIIILTDDQDLRMGSMDHLPKVKKYLTDEGMYFNHHYATVALCCPSRASMWTGKAAHNTKITDLKPPYGGFPRFISEGYNKKWLPVWLQETGYKTYFTGKLMNQHNIENYKNGLEDMGLDGHDFMIEPGTYQYVNTTIQHNMEKPVSHPGKYATDLLADLSTAWIDDAAEKKSPFFLAINPVNPHSNYDWNNGKPRWTNPVPADRHKDEFQDAIVPRNTKNFNPDSPSGASWVHGLDKLDDATLKDNDIHYRRRLQALQAVDDLVEKTIQRLEHHKMLDNTYIIYTSDNGFHISQHRLTPGKRCPYEEDVNVPLVIRGPKVPKGKTVDFVTSHLDIAPTVVNWAGAKGPGDFDGAVIPADGTPGSQEPWEHVQIEHWGLVSDKDNVPKNLIGKVNTYKAIRVIGPKYNLYYAVWCDGDHEVYDMTTDPYQMNNLYNSSQTILGASMKKLEDRLDALTLVLKACAGDSCRQPWEQLHKGGKVKTLVDALKPEYDAFYKNQNKVKFSQCAKSYFVQNELPIKYHTYGSDGSIQDRDVDWWMQAG
ncbi:alkaline-phosphatase-like protein [Penicillium cataractarum]|uniref:Arylsulfatase n=1 Tax=Penicillium cataractarum TaxID=2100454 RepID=A0A9W9S2V9_9EURO|nr:alkaline-phosphatase-like protein [Penicillium cataractarum]KAJ5371047.1 alkaline-phosphatase-like protein [Penicillium cataractarum]